MCGIVGAIGRGLQNGHKQAVRDAAQLLQHRGPDNLGFWSDDSSKVALAHTRLAIIDTSPSGAQPMVSSCGRYVISFNGEIYNHLSLRQELEYEWQGHSDTETLVECIAAWGVEKTLSKIIGMFAFAVWEVQAGLLYLARDRAGEKPLYYGEIDGVFVFSSELRPFKAFKNWQPKIDQAALGLYFRYSHIPAPYSIFEGLKKLEAGTYAVVNHATLAIDHHQYWSAYELYDGPKSIEDDAEVVEEKLHSLLRDAVESQMISDVPIGAFLSGGTDSSLIVAIMQSLSNKPIETFNIGFDSPKYDESVFAKAIAEHLGTNHHEHLVTASECLSYIYKIPDIYDEPFADSSQIPMSIVSGFAKKSVTVALSGDGGDELFGGYNRYIVANRFYNKLQHVPYALRLAIGELFKVVANPAFEVGIDKLQNMLPIRYQVAYPSDKLEKLANIIRQKEPKNIYQTLIHQWDDSRLLRAGGGCKTLIESAELWPMTSYPEQLMYVDLLTYLPNDILTKVDRAAMSVSLETRVPFLDKNVMEYAVRLPLEYKIKGGNGKWLLKRILEQYIPAEHIYRPKMGFTIPLGEWLRGDLRDWAESFLNRDALTAIGYVNPGVVLEKWHQHLRGERNWQHHLWSVLMFQVWYENFFTNE